MNETSFQESINDYKSFMKRVDVASAAISGQKVEVSKEVKKEPSVVAKKSSPSVEKKKKRQEVSFI